MNEQYILENLDTAATVAEIEYEINPSKDNFKKALRWAFISYLEKDGYKDAEKIFESDFVQNWLKKEYPPVYGDIKK